MGQISLTSLPGRVAQASLFRWRRRGAAWLAGFSLMGSALLPLGGHAQVQARRADDFINSVGVGTHWEYGDTPYGYAFPQVLQKLQDLGIRHVRGGMRSAELTSVGISSTFTADVPDDQDADYGLVQQLMTDLKAKLAAGHKIDVIEGPNEPDLFWGNRSYRGEGRNRDNRRSNIRGTVLFMQDLYAAVKADPATRNLTVVGPSVTRTVGVDLAANELENYVDWGNFHPYCSGNSFSFPAPYAGLDNYWWNSTHPSANLTEVDQLDNHQNATALSDWLFGAAHRPYGAKPMAATETGYTTFVGGTSEAVHAKYMPRLFLEYFRLGIQRTYSYELVDVQDDPGNTVFDNHFGLLRHDLTPKPAFNAVKSLMNLLSDPAGNNFTPGTLNYSVQVTPPANYGRTQYVRHQLFQKQNGTFYLVLYHEISNEDSSKDPDGNYLASDADRARTRNLELTHPAMPTTLSLPAGIRQATVYAYDQNFAFQGAPATITNNQLTVNVQDQVMVVELASSATTPPVALRPADNPSGTVAGLAYQYYEATGLSQLPDFSTLTPTATGTTTTFDLAPRRRNADYAFRYAGYVQVPQDGQYTFYTSSDDGSRLYVGAQLVVDNDGLHGAQERNGTIGLRAGWHALTVGFFQRGGGQTLSVSYQGPGLSKRAVPAAALAYVPAATSNGLVSGATYRLVARHSGKALDVPGNSMANEVQLQQYAVNNTAAQAWVVTLGADGYYTLTHQGTGQVLDLYANDESDGAAVQQYQNTGVDAQKWRLVPTGDGYYKVFHKDATKCLDVNGGESATQDGALVHLWEYYGNRNQQWQFDLLSNNRQASALATGNPNCTASTTHLTAYPNPAAELATFAYELAQPGPVRLEVVDALGRRAALVLDGAEQPAGRHQATLRVDTLPAGTYRVVLTTSAAVESRALLIVR